MKAYYLPKYLLFHYFIDILTAKVWSNNFLVKREALFYYHVPGFVIRHNLFIAATFILPSSLFYTGSMSTTTSYAKCHHIGPTVQVSTNPKFNCMVKLVCNYSPRYQQETVPTGRPTIKKLEK
jgi:hypothetical protein